MAWMAKVKKQPTSTGELFPQTASKLPKNKRGTALGTIACIPDVPGSAEIRPR